MFVREILILSLVFALVMLNSLASAQIQYYGIDTTVNDNGNTIVNMSVTYSKPEPNFTFTLLGKINNLQYSSLGNSINCSLQYAGYSTVLCSLGLTEEKRSFDFSFDTNDLVKPLDSKFFFSGDFSLNKQIDKVYVSVKLPEGMGLVNDSSSVTKLSFPENATILSDGRRIIVIWNLQNTGTDNPLRFQLLYENISGVLPTIFRLRYLAVIAAGVAAGLGFVWYRYLREPQNLVLSVLDNYERQVVDILVSNGGNVDQRKIVQDTNLSKAKISRVVKSLVGRGIVEVERHGRSNKIKVVKKKLQL